MPASGAGIQHHELGAGVYGVMPALKVEQFCDQAVMLCIGMLCTGILCTCMIRWITDLLQRFKQGVGQGIKPVAPCLEQAVPDQGVAR